MLSMGVLFSFFIFLQYFCLVLYVVSILKKNVVKITMKIRLPLFLNVFKYLTIIIIYTGGYHRFRMLKITYDCLKFLEARKFIVLLIFE